MQPSQFRSTIAGLLKNAVTDLLASRVMHHHTLRIEGVLCLLVDGDNEDIVIKFHDTCRRRFDQKMIHEVNDSEVDLSSENISTSSNVDQYQIKDEPEDLTTPHKVNHQDPVTEDADQRLNDVNEHDMDADEEKITTAEEEVMKAMMLSSPSSDSGIAAFPEPTIITMPAAYREPETRELSRDTFNFTPDRRRGRKAPTGKVSVPTGATHSSTGLVCNLCDTQFRAVQDCTQHYRSVHGHYLCHICFKTFSQSGSLTRHLRLHTGTKPFNCNECGLQFTRKDALVKHKVKYHTEGENRCPLCDTAFDSRASLRAHFKEQHGTDNVYLCPNCSLSFVGWGEYLSHTRTCVSAVPIHNTTATNGRRVTHETAPVQQEEPESLVG